MPIPTDRVHPSWTAALESHAEQISAISARLDRDRSTGVSHFPENDRIFRAFEQTLDTVRVVIVGQDPYPTPGHAIGLSFAVDRQVQPLPRSLTNIYRELHDDLGIEPATHGDLSSWVESGVLLLNRVLTVKSGHAGSDRGIGWEDVTASALAALAQRGGPLVAILWGKDAQSAAPLLGDVPIIASAHPSPLSARNGFFGSRPFSRANDLLVAQDGAPVDWRIER
ncbi:MAG: uracil-DNA glycosylase [Microbacteriaceae bacterium]